MNKEIRTLYFQEKVPKKNLKPGDVFIWRINRGEYRGRVFIYKVPVWEIQAIGFLLHGVWFPQRLKTAIDIILNDYPFLNFQYVQHPENQIEMLDLTTTNN